MTTVLLVRHGETLWNREGRIQGWAPTTLTERGRDQASRAGEYLADAFDVDRVVASDLRRTRETAALLREAGVGPDADPDFERGWRERDFGVYQGLPYDEVFERHPEHDATTGIVSLDATPEGGESMLDLYDRVLGAFQRLVVGAADDETVVVVTHGGPIYIVVGHAKGQDMVTAIKEGHQSNCAVNELRHEDGRVSLVSENATPWD